MLGDSGSEFLNFAKIETGLDGSGRTWIFYCDPVRPNQKRACEKNYVELRKILPKGADLDALEAWDVAEACSHANSRPRPGQGDCPSEARLSGLAWEPDREPRHPCRLARRRDHDAQAARALAIPF